jgi:hypothetical protein
MAAAQAQRWGRAVTGREGADFNPLSASAGELAERCLPPVPDPREAPIAYSNWVRAMASRPCFATASTESDLTILRTQVNQTVSQVSSQNWSGGFVRPRTPDPMVLVQGRWIVPDTPPQRGVAWSASSIWVGLDGYDPTSRLMPQIGTAQIPPELWVGQRPDDQHAWWQIWVPKSQLVRIPIKIRRKDAIYAQVHVLTATRVSLFLKNETTNRAFAIHVDVPKESDGPFERRTAEWIVERPLTPRKKESSADDFVSRPLTDYGETAFTDCNAATLSASHRLHEFQLQRARLIRMAVWDDPVVRGRIVSRAERINDDALRMRYIRASCQPAACA